MVGYSTRSMAEFIGMSPNCVRRYVRRGLLEPVRDDRGHFNFEFQDLVLMRTAKRLLDAEVSSQKTLRLMLKIKSDNAAARKLASVRIITNGKSVLVKSHEAFWNVDTGQGVLDFDSRSSHFAITSLHGPDLFELLEQEDLDSDDWYNLGLDLEDMDVERAPEAYQRAIQVDSDNVDAHVNLGRLKQIDGYFEAAKSHYLDALSLYKEHQLANYNMGTLCDELDQMEAASRYYAISDQVPDAHFNLARIFELKGDELSARRHIHAYNRLLEAT